MRILVFAITLCVLCCPGVAWSEGSGGSSAPYGEREGWPCAGCNVVTPAGYTHDEPAPLLVTLHGDEGDPDYIQWKLEDAALAAGYLMLNLECPRSLGCGRYEGSWWRWEAYSNQHDIDWLGRQIDQVEAEYNVERNRVYLAGFSGGSSYLSEYPWRFSMRYAGLVYLAGGYDPARHGYRCDDAACRIPAYFLIGSEDFLLPGARKIRDYLQGCGHEVEWVLVQGEDHGIVDAGVPAIFAWLDARPHLCRAEPESEEEPESEAEPEAESDPEREPAPGPETEPDMNGGEDGEGEGGGIGRAQPGGDDQPTAEWVEEVTEDDAPDLGEDETGCQMKYVPALKMNWGRR